MGETVAFEEYVSDVRAPALVFSPGGERSLGVPLATSSLATPRVSMSGQTGIDPATVLASRPRPGYFLGTAPILPQGPPPLDTLRSGEAAGCQRDAKRAF